MLVLLESQQDIGCLAALVGADDALLAHQIQQAASPRVSDRELRRLWVNIEDFYRKVFLSDDLIGLRNSVLNALILARAALENPTSRGCHYRDDSRPSGGAVPPNEAHRRGLE